MIIHSDDVTSVKLALCIVPCQAPHCPSSTYIELNDELIRMISYKYLLSTIICRIRLRSPKASIQYDASQPLLQSNSSSWREAHVLQSLHCHQHGLHGRRHELPCIYPVKQLRDRDVLVDGYEFYGRMSVGERPSTEQMWDRPGDGTFFVQLGGATVLLRIYDQERNVLVGAPFQLEEYF